MIYSQINSRHGFSKVVLMKQIFIFLSFSLGFISSLSAQEYDLDDLKQVPKTNSLPVRRPTLGIQPVKMPEKQIDLKVNYWRNWTTFGINANQASFSDNWQNGGVNSISVGATFNSKFDYTKEDRNFISELDLKYGRLQNKDQLARKTNDRMLWDNKYSIKFARKWSFFASLTFESQFDNGFTYGSGSLGQDTITRKISSFMAPGYLTEALGVEVQPDKTLSIRFGTGTARQTFVLRDDVLPPTSETDTLRFGIRRPGTFRNELAFQLVSNLDRNLSSNINIKARYAFFANYEDMRNASHRLDATLTARVTRVISTTLNGIILYDPLMDHAVQTSQSIAIGILYKWPR